MSRYDGLIIPRSYSEYINKTDAATLQQALQLSGVLSGAVAAGDNKAVKSSAVNAALSEYINKTDAATLQQALQLPGVLSGAVAAGDNKAVKSSAVNAALSEYDIKYDTTVIRDFNLAIPALGKEKLYLIPVNGTQQNKPDSTSEQWLLRANRKPVQSGISDEQRVIQEAICFSGAGHEIKYFLRTATSSDNGTTWEWGDWEKVTTETDLIKTCKNITPKDLVTRKINFSIPSVNWFCGEVFGNLNNYGNIAFYISVTSSDSITKTNIIGDNTKINCTIDTTNKLLEMTCDTTVSFKSITFIHS